MEQSPSFKVNTKLNWLRNCPHFMSLKNFLPCIHRSISAARYIQSTWPNHIVVRSSLILSSRLQTSVTFGVYNQNIYPFLTCLLLVTRPCSSLWNLWLFNPFCSPAILSLLGPIIQTPSVCVLPLMWQIGFYPAFSTAIWKYSIWTNECWGFESGLLKKGFQICVCFISFAS
jgi:hypothetical protein